MSNAYVFDTLIDDDNSSFVAIGHTLGAVVLYNQRNMDQEYLFLTILDLEELLDLAKSSGDPSE